MLHFDCCGSVKDKIRFFVTDKIPDAFVFNSLDSIPCLTITSITKKF